ncbi:hypothetical protein D3C76_1599630 [compost metagenome]
MHALNLDKLRESRVGHFSVNQTGGHNADRFAAGRQDRIGDRPHKSMSRSPVN